LQRPADALSRSRRALELFRAAGHLPGQAMALNDVSFSPVLLGGYKQAIANCEQAPDAIWEAGGRRGPGRGISRPRTAV